MSLSLNRSEKYHFFKVRKKNMNGKGGVARNIIEILFGLSDRKSIPKNEKMLWRKRKGEKIETDGKN